MVGDERLELRSRVDRGVALLLPRYASLPLLGVDAHDLRGGGGQSLDGSRGFPTLQFLRAFTFSLARNRISVACCQRSQMTSISALLAMDFSEMCGTRS